MSKYMITKATLLTLLAAVNFSFSFVYAVWRSPYSATLLSHLLNSLCGPNAFLIAGKEIYFCNFPPTNTLSQGIRISWIRYFNCVNTMVGYSACAAATLLTIDWKYCYGEVHPPVYIQKNIFILILSLYFKIKPIVKTTIFRTGP